MKYINKLKKRFYRTQKTKWDRGVTIITGRGNAYNISGIGLKVLSASLCLMVLFITMLVSFSINERNRNQDLTAVVEQKEEDIDMLKRELATLNQRYHEKSQAVAEAETQLNQIESMVEDIEEGEGSVKFYAVPQD